MLSWNFRVAENVFIASERGHLDLSSLLQQSGNEPVAIADAIPAVMQASQRAYHIHAKDYEDGPRRLITKVLFFE
jgi:hypothetical protein